MTVRHPWLVFLLSLWCVSVGRADTVVLKDGRKLEGEVVEETDALVKLKVRGVMVSFKKEEVQEVTRTGGKGSGEAARPAAEKIAGAEIPRADRPATTGQPEVDEARRRTAAARESLARLLGRLRSGAGSASNIVKEYQSLREEVEKRKPKLDEARARANSLVDRFNEWVGRYNSENNSGRVSEATQRGLAKAESEMKSARANLDRLVSQHNRDVDRLDKMRANFESGQDKMEENSDELVKAFRESDEACVALVEAERRAGLVPSEAGAAGASEQEAALSTEEASVRWPSPAELSGDRKALAGRRVSFEARLGSVDPGTHRVQVYVGDSPDPSGWDREVPATLVGPVEAHSGEHVVLEGTVSAAAEHPVQIDRVLTLK